MSLIIYARLKSGKNERKFGRLYDYSILRYTNDICNNFSNFIITICNDSLSLLLSSLPTRLRRSSQVKERLSWDFEISIVLLLSRPEKSTGCWSQHCDIWNRWVQLSDRYGGRTTQWFTCSDENQRARHLLPAEHGQRLIGRRVVAQSVGVDDGTCWSCDAIWMRCLLSLVSNPRGHRRMVMDTMLINCYEFIAATVHVASLNGRNS